MTAILLREVFADQNASSQASQETQTVTDATTRLMELYIRLANQSLHLVERQPAAVLSPEVKAQAAQEEIKKTILKAVTEALEQAEKTKLRTHS